MNICSFINLDTQFYRKRHADLKKFSDEELVRHYERHGYREGRQSSLYAVRENFKKLLKSKNVLEIGPFFSPFLSGGHVRYADVISTKEMVERAKKLGGDANQVPNIDYVVRDGSLKVIEDKFDAVFSAHNIEHQPNIIEHLREVAACLSEGGKFYLIIPNQNYCFDANLPPSKISEIFNAEMEQRKRHTIGSVIEHRAMTTHNNSMQHWKQNKIENFIPLDPMRVASAVSEYQNALGQYIDVHAWQFTPFSFSNILNCLISMETIPFKSVSVNGPVYGRNEFTAILTK